MAKIAIVVKKKKPALVEALDEQSENGKELAKAMNENRVSVRDGALMIDKEFSEAELKEAEKAFRQPGRTVLVSPDGNVKMDNSSVTPKTVARNNPDQCLPFGMRGYFFGG